jgi:hypothetical protein
VRPDPRLLRLTALLLATTAIAPPFARAQTERAPIPAQVAPTGPAAPPPTSAAAPAQHPAVAAPAPAPASPPAPQAAAPAPQAAAPAPQAAAPAPAPASQQAEVDPPARVGRLARIQGAVSYHGAGADHWDTATVNFPVSTGNAFWTQPEAQAVIEVSASRLAMAASTEFDLNTLDMGKLVATLPQGEVFIQLDQLRPDETWTVQTPRGQVVLRGDGVYAIVAGDTEHPTQVTVVKGAADVTGPNLDLKIAAGQTGLIEGTETFAGRIVPAEQDPFLVAMVAAEQPAPAPSVPLPPAVAQMPGCQALSNYGSWQASPQYGQVWYPRVEAGWAPYRHGHWAYVAPWGWTWVDDAPWGFAPFHYGRWAEFDGRWGWVPGDYAGGGAPAEWVPPVYAPALVTFVGTDPGVPLGAFAAGALAAGAIGWIALGPHEPYYPWFHAGPRYVREVNITHVTNITEVVNNYGNRSHFGNVQINQFVNRGSLTVVPTAAMVGSRPIASAFHPVAPGELGHFHPVFGAEPVRPGAGTLGMTPGLAGRLGIAGGAAAIAAAHPFAPGPTVRPGGFAGPLPLRPANATPGAFPGRPEPGRPEPGRPEPGRPELGRPEPGRFPPLAAPGAGPTLPLRPSERPAERAGVPGEGRPGDLRPGALRPGEGRPAEGGRPGEARPGPQFGTATPHGGFPEPGAHPPGFAPPAGQARPFAAPSAPRPAFEPHPAPSGGPGGGPGGGPAGFHAPPQFRPAPQPQAFARPGPQFQAPRGLPAQPHFAAPPQPHFAAPPQPHFAAPPQPHFAAPPHMAAAAPPPRPGPAPHGGGGGGHEPHRP